jgi:shikimate kinase
MGMTGVGKTSMGQELAKRLDFRFIDVDELIEKKFNLILQEIVDLYGDQSFIEIEEQAVLDLDPMDRSVISPGGSVIYSAKAMEFLSQNSIVIFLDASFESIKKRIHNQSSRGIIGLKGRKLLDLFEERRPLYQKYAERTIVLGDDLDRDAVVKEILQKLPNEKKEGGNEMTKKQVGYADCIDETLKGFDEDRVLLVSQGKQGPPNVMTIGWGQVGIIWRKPIFTVLV